MTTKMIRASCPLVIVSILLCCFAFGDAELLANIRNVYDGHDIKITITEGGLSPKNVVLRRGAPAQITFVRKVADTCATVIVIQELGINVDLPLNEPVSLEVKPKSVGQYDYGCGSSAFHGTIMVR